MRKVLVGLCTLLVNFKYFNITYCFNDELFANKYTIKTQNSITQMAELCLTYQTLASDRVTSGCMTITVTSCATSQSSSRVWDSQETWCTLLHKRNDNE